MLGRRWIAFRKVAKNMLALCYSDEYQVTSVIRLSSSEDDSNTNTALLMPLNTTTMDEITRQIFLSSCDSKPNASKIFQLGIYLRSETLVVVVAEEMLVLRAFGSCR